MTELPDESLDKTRVVVFPLKHDKFWVNKFCAVVISVLALSRGKVLLFHGMQRYGLEKLIYNC